VKNGSDWILNGAKTFPSSAGVAWLYLIVARTDTSGPNISNNTGFLVPADTPGLSFGRVENKMGRRTQRNQEIFLENVRVPDEHVFGKIGGVFESVYVSRPTFPSSGHIYLGASTIGLARAAYEEALKFAGERVAWGKPIREHQLIARKLVDMRLKIEAMRAFVWKVAWALEHPDQPELSDGLSYLGGEATKYYATEQIVDFVREAMQIFGAVGYTRDMPIEKWMRDAIGLSICGTTNEMHSIILSQKL
jgi:alkylation response protein AidB-like acyl-CoA dehydrogenase